MKTLGISLDGVIRDFHSQFDKMYRKVFIYNEALVSAKIPDQEEARTKGISNDSLVAQEETEEELTERSAHIKELESQLITLPVTTGDLLNHYKFEEQEDSFMQFDDIGNISGNEKSFLSEDEVLSKFINDDYPFQIFARAQSYDNAMEEFNRLQAYGQREGLFDTVLICRATGKAIPATYAFLSTHHCRARKIIFVEEHHEKIDHCDILIGAEPEALQSVGKDKDAIRIERPWNQYENTENHFQNLREVYSSGILEKFCS